MLEERIFRGDGDSGLIELPTKVVLPMPEAEFLAKYGPLPSMAGDLRRFQRRYFRCKAPFRVLATLPAFRRDGGAYIVYTRDVSVGGLGFIAHEQLYPSEQAIVELPNLGERIISITSCRYVSPSCYEAGGTFLNGATPS